MPVEITIKNYRCFPDTNPVCIPLRKGFTAFVGTNNSGKSSLLKFFYEFRRLLSSTQNNNQVISALQGGMHGFDFANSVLDREEVFCNTNDRNLEVELRFVDRDPPTGQNPLPLLERLTFTISRERKDYYTVKLKLTDGTSSPFQEGKLTIEGDNGKVLHCAGKPLADFFLC